nr:hypothetical protein [Tanacetum cinerariifolium]
TRVQGVAGGEWWRVVGCSVEWWRGARNVGEELQGLLMLVLVACKFGNVTASAPKSHYEDDMPYSCLIEYPKHFALTARIWM